MLLLLKDVALFLDGFVIKGLKLNTWRIWVEVKESFVRVDVLSRFLELHHAFLEIAQGSFYKAVSLLEMTQQIVPKLLLQEWRLVDLCDVELTKVPEGKFLSSRFLLV